MVFPAESLIIVSVKEAFARYLAVERNYSPHTLTAYIADLSGLDDYLCGQGKFSGDSGLFSAEGAASVGHRDLRAWMGDLMTNGISARSVARKLAAAKTFFAYLQQIGTLAANPAARVKTPGFDKKLPSFLQEAEAERLLGPSSFALDFEGVRDRCMLEIFYGCGLRRSELAGLTHAHVDTYARTLRVTGKGNKARILPFGKAVAESIANYRNILAAQFPDLQPNAPVSQFFLRKDGKPLPAESVYSIVRKYLVNTCSLAQQGPHVLRHTFATHLLNHGADLNAIKELLGHESLAATQVYTHNSITQLSQIHQQAHPRAVK